MLPSIFFILLQIDLIANVCVFYFYVCLVVGIVININTFAFPMCNLSLNSHTKQTYLYVCMYVPRPLSKTLIHTQSPHGDIKQKATYAFRLRDWTLNFLSRVPNSFSSCSIYFKQVFSELNMGQLNPFTKVVHGLQVEQKQNLQ